MSESIIRYQGTELEEIVVQQVSAMYPEIGADPALEKYVKLGAACIQRVTDTYGTPHEPKFYRGSQEATYMVYHSGQSKTSSGHTSMAPEGFGVPRNVILIARKINYEAWKNNLPEVFQPHQLVIPWVAACAHDVRQNDGRSVDMVKGGDERFSAQLIYASARAARIGHEEAEEMAIDTLATMYSHKQSKHAIDYTQSPNIIRSQQLVAFCDLQYSVRSRSRWINFLNAVEMTGLKMQNRVLHEALEFHGIQPETLTTLEEIVDFIPSYGPLESAFYKTIDGGAKFAENVHLETDAIDAVCGTIMQDFAMSINGITSSVSVAYMRQLGLLPSPKAILDYVQPDPIDGYSMNLPEWGAT